MHKFRDGVARSHFSSLINYESCNLILNTSIIFFLILDMWLSVWSVDLVLNRMEFQW